ncbi:ABC transporter permease [Streptomyces demainii]|uniref:ABC-2 type transport system permease protein n=1 Tax=Streptomyces demainii TaxID=588122 RepID=A0ABT9KNJ5_9ACTN|nr:ABC transporter permease [Streptomyces demainii]MDP9609985.1 ABC-2 type transport system permease protein [Streptomyces demainii]
MSSSARSTSSADGTTGGKTPEEKPAAGASASGSQGRGQESAAGRPVDPRTAGARPAENAGATDPRAGDPKTGDARTGDTKAGDPRTAEIKAAEDDGFEDTRTVLVRSKSSAPRPAPELQKATPNPPVKHETAPHQPRPHEARPHEPGPHEPGPHGARSTRSPDGSIGDTLTLVIKPMPAPSASQAAQDAKAALNAIIAAADARSPLMEPQPEPELELELPDEKRRGGRHRRRANRWRTFFFILWRDIFVTGREMGPFLGQVIVEPFFMLFVFGKVLGEIGFTQPGFQQVLLPGVVALNSFLVALQNTALPLAIDFSWTKEIEDRLLSPIPVGLVAVEKAVFGAMRGLIGSLVMIPIGLALLDDVSWPLDKMPVTLGILSLGGLVGGCVGLTLGTLAPARHISIVFAMTLTPIMFTGATQFPWRSLETVRWFQVLCTFNPLTYITEAMRGLLLTPGPKTPESIPLWICFSAIGAAIVIFGFIGIRGFNRRAQD